MVGFVLQHPTEPLGGAPVQLAVVSEEVVLGHIARDPFRPIYRYFPGADNDVAFLLEHTELEELKRIIEQLCADMVVHRWAVLSPPEPSGQRPISGVLANGM